MRDYLKDRLSRLNKCKPKWDILIEEKIKGDEKCSTHIKDKVDAFMQAKGTFTSSKGTYFTKYIAWFELWKTKSKFDRMCSVRAKNFRFSQKTDDKASEHERLIFQHHFEDKHKKENILRDAKFKAIENELMSLQYDSHRFKKAKTEKDDENHNECQDCIKVPEKFSMPELSKFWKILISMQTEMGEWW